VTLGRLEILLLLSCLRSDQLALLIFYYLMLHQLITIVDVECLGLFLNDDRGISQVQICSSRQDTHHVFRLIEDHSIGRRFGYLLLHCRIRQVFYRTGN
jgi:hypothetical protein